jgi:single-strand DNA-binding protein
MADNSITVIGNITRDPELRFTNSGRPQVSFGLAVNRRYQQNGEWVEQTSFFNIVAWAQLAENVSESLSKGSRVIVNGRLEQRSWETQDGEKRSVIEIVADEVGPSLRWATAKIERNERSSEMGDRPRSGGSSTSGGPAAPPTESYGDEEPF